MTRKFSLYYWSFVRRNHITKSQWCGLLCFLWCQPEQIAEQIVGIQVNLDVLALIWRLCKDCELITAGGVTYGETLNECILYIYICINTYVYNTKEYVLNAAIKISGMMKSKTLAMSYAPFRWPPSMADNSINVVTYQPGILIHWRWRQ